MPQPPKPSEPIRRALATCALAALTTTAALAQDTKLTVWSDPARASVFETYSKADNGVTLDVVTVAPDELVTKLQLAMRAGSEVPDVIWMSTIDVAAQLSTRRSNFLMDLTGKVDEASSPSSPPTPTRRATRTASSCACATTWRSTSPG